MFDAIPSLFDVFPWQMFVVIFVLCVGRAYLKGASFAKDHTRCKDKVAVVTGCSGGIGKQIARDLCQRGATVHMLCRSKQRGEEARKSLVMLGCHIDRLVLHTVDLSSFDSVRQFAASLSAPKVDILVNNAGVMLYPKYKLTEDGHESVWQTNYLGHFLLTELLMPKLEAADAARVVNVSAIAHFYADGIDLALVDRREYFDSRQAYARSKLAQVLHARELSRRLQRRNARVTVNAVHPGICYTRIMRHTPLGNNKLLAVPLSPIAWYLLKTPKDGAQTPVWAALSKEVDGMTGMYFAEMHAKEPSDKAKDDTLAANLYAYSVDACKLDDGRQ